MIRMKVDQGDNNKWTVGQADGGNGKILMSSTSQGYDRRARAEEIARRCAPRGDEPVELVVRDRSGAVLHREMLHKPGAVSWSPPRAAVIASSAQRAGQLAAELGLRNPLLAGRRSKYIGRGVSELTAVLIEDTAGTLPPATLEELRPALAPTGGQVYRVRRVL